jgi:ACR3 family arsenite efflux pump ArsB
MAEVLRSGVGERGLVAATGPRLGVAARYLSVWVALAMIGGVALGKELPAATASLRAMEFGQESHVNIPIALLIWLMMSARLKNSGGWN